MSYFRVKMHQIQFRLGPRPRPRWVSLQHSQTPVAEFKGPTSKGREGRGGEGRAGKGKGGERGGPPDSCLHPPRLEILDNLSEIMKEVPVTMKRRVCCRRF